MKKVLDAQQGEFPLRLAVHADSSSGMDFCTFSLENVQKAAADRLTQLLAQLGSSTVVRQEDVTVQLRRLASRDTAVWYSMLVRCGEDAAALVAAHVRRTGSLAMDWGRSAPVHAFLYQGWDAVEAQYLLQINVGGPACLTAEVAKAYLEENKVEVDWVVEVSTQGGPAVLRTPLADGVAAPDLSWVRMHPARGQRFLALVTGGHNVVRCAAPGGVVLTAKEGFADPRPVLRNLLWLQRRLAPMPPKASPPKAGPPAAAGAGGVVAPGAAQAAGGTLSWAGALAGHGLGRPALATMHAPAQVEADRVEREAPAAGPGDLAGAVEPVSGVTALADGASAGGAAASDDEEYGAGYASSDGLMGHDAGSGSDVDLEEVEMGPRGGQEIVGADPALRDVSMRPRLTEAGFKRALEDGGDPGGARHRGQGGRGRGDRDDGSEGRRQPRVAARAAVVVAGTVAAEAAATERAVTPLPPVPTAAVGCPAQQCVGVEERPQPAAAAATVDAMDRAVGGATAEAAGEAAAAAAAAAAAETATEAAAGGTAVAEAAGDAGAAAVAPADLAAPSAALDALAAALAAAPAGAAATANGPAVAAGLATCALAPEVPLVADGAVPSPASPEGFRAARRRRGGTSLWQRRSSRTLTECLPLVLV